MKKYIVTIIVLFFLIFFSIGGYFVYGKIKSNESNNIETVKQKCNTEIEYLSSNIIGIMNDINNISYTNYKLVNEEIPASDSSSDTQSESNQNQEQNNSQSNENTINRSNITIDNIQSVDTKNIKWEEINNKIQEIYSSWTTIMMDLTSVNVNKDNLLKFNNILDVVSKNIKNKDKSQTLISLADLYNLIALYINDFSSDNEKVNIYNVRSNILYSYAYSESDNWQKVNEYIIKAEEGFATILNNQINNVNKIDIINKSYILLNELKQDGKNNDKNAFLINYANLMQELQTL